MENNLPKRKQIRLENYDYSTQGAYFITVCTYNRKNMLSQIDDESDEEVKSFLTEYGKTVEFYINNFPNNLCCTIDRYIIMPNHFHLIIIISYDDEKRAIRESPLQHRSVISKAVGYIKMNSSKKIHENFGNVTVWQRGYHDHIIRNRQEYEKIAKYVYENPLRWKFDKLYSE